MSADPALIRKEAARRRTFAIISHPDAGKTTLTEKFLLYAGAIEAAGAVKSRKVERTARSDWMKMEQERGISISSTVLRFDHGDAAFNLLDTPGHRDFSEDTYRVLSGVDAAIMVLDGARGVEPQTKKLFEVCARRGTPLVTFINKMDRPTLDGLALLDDIESQLDLQAVPVTWPVKPANRFLGVVDRRDRRFHRFDAGGQATGRTSANAMDWEDAEGFDGKDDISENLDLLDAFGASHDPRLLGRASPTPGSADRGAAPDSDISAAFLAGEVTPVFFGSALSNFGVELLLDAIRDYAPAPSARATLDGGHRAVDEDFSGFVFKIQANMDPRHRDRIAFVRICSGEFERGAQVTCTRSGRRIAAKYAHQVFGQERITVETAYPGDVIGLVNATDLRIGDTLYEDNEVEYPPLPVFTPEFFRTARPGDRSRTKQFRDGLQQLDEEGVIQILRHRDLGDVEPVVAAVGELQFEVMKWRMEQEFNAPAILDPTSYKEARRTDEESIEALVAMRDVEVYRRPSGIPLALFRDRWQLERIERDHPELTLDHIVTS